MHRLPEIPAALLACRPWQVGAAARRRLGGPGLHQPPELWVDAPDVGALCPDATPAPGWPGAWAVGGWIVRSAGPDPVAALCARGYPVDAVALTPAGEVIDPLGGVADLRARTLRVEAAALQADPSLLVQGPALLSELAWRPADALDALWREHAGLVLRADRDALRRALTRLLVGQRPSAALGLLERTGVLPLVLPEVAALIDFHRSSRFHHKDVWQHTRQVVMQAVPRATVRWAALLHDIGKTYTRSYGEDRQVHFLLHDELGAVMCEGIAARLRFPAPLAARVERLVRLHLRANLYDPAWSDAAIRRFALEAGPELEELLLLSRADVTSKRPGRRRQAMYQLHELQGRVRRVLAEDEARRPVVPKGLGKAIIDQLGVAPGPEVGRLRARCEAAVRRGALRAAGGGEIDVAACIAWLRSQRDAA
ncbi:MAG: HD domain-containing protein [Myxococcales bacterium]|nr:HD domain-containing protein [Myxococcales bacterium]